MTEAIGYLAILAGALICCFGLLHVLLRDRVAIAKLMDAHYARKELPVAWMPEPWPPIDSDYEERWRT